LYTPPLSSRDTEKVERVPPAVVLPAALPSVYDALSEDPPEPVKVIRPPDVLPASHVADEPRQTSPTALLPRTETVTVAPPPFAGPL
jgi:hypothetical protein